MGRLAGLESGSISSLAYLMPTRCLRKRYAC